MVKASAMMATHRTTGIAIGSAVLLLAFGVAPKGPEADPRPTDPDIEPNTFELLSHQASGYRFQIIPSDASPPSGFEEPGFDDTAFETGSAAFGNGGGGAGDGVDCPLRPTVQSTWPVDTQLVVRRVVEVPAGATNVRVMVSVDNDIVAVFWDGTRIAEPVEHEECPILDEFRFDVSQELVEPGQHLLAVHVRDRGAESFFDARILAELSGDDLGRSNRQVAAVVDRALPRVPVSDVTTDCPLADPGQRSAPATTTFRVDATGTLGRIEITRFPTSPSNEIVTKLFLDEDMVASSRATDTQLAFEADPRLVNGSDGVVRPEIQAFDSVLRSPEFSNRLMACVAPPLAATQCSEACRGAARRARFLIFGVSKISYAGGGLGAGLDEGVAFLATESVNTKECACLACCDAGMLALDCVDDARRPGRFDFGC